MRYGDLAATGVALRGLRGDWPRRVMVGEGAMVPRWRMSSAADSDDLLAALSRGKR